MHRGYIKIWRKLEDSGLLQMHGTFCLFIHMLLKASHKDVRIGMTEIKRGQFLAGRHKLAEAVGMSEQQLRTCEKKLYSLGMIEGKSTNKFTVYTIVNYDNYQDGNDADNKQLTNEQQTTNKRLTTIQEHKHIRTKEHKQDSAAFALQSLLNLGVEKQAAEDWLIVRKAKRAPLTKTALDELVREAEKAGITVSDAVKICASKNWQGFNSSWDWKGSGAKAPKQDSFESKDYGKGVSAL